MEKFDPNGGWMKNVAEARAEYFADLIRNINEWATLNDDEEEYIDKLLTILDNLWNIETDIIEK